MTIKKTIRIIGCGNLLMGDDGVGIHTVEKLTAMKDKLEGGASVSDPLFSGLSADALTCLKEADIMDAGVSGLDMLCFIEGFDKIIIIDALKSDHNLGAILKIKGEDLLEGDDVGKMMSSHDVSVPTVLKIAREVQGLPEIVVYGVEIQKHPDVVDVTSEMSPLVAAAIDRLIPLVLEELNL
ncbi:MAG: hydrogenase maturation protease [Methanosarcinales archaeon]|jgi:hydrogenase maturation protease|nr:hydrogenase maturation protease [Methanosarcinales archaeon]